VFCDRALFCFSNRFQRLFRMFTIDLTLKGTPLALSVERKEAADAEALYNKILKAIQASSAQVVELTCDRQTEKKIGVLSTEISAVQLSDKSNAGGSGRPPGFWQLSQ
jgi:hypothetical protein